MLRSIFVLLSCGVGCFVYAHPHCHNDQREVDLGRDLTFCSMEYAPEGICCTEAEETALEETFNAAGALTAECADYYKQILCGVCGSYSGHLYERLAADLETEDGLSMKNDFCTEYIAACDEQIDLPVYGNPEFGEVDYCTMHTGGGDEDLFWSYPYELSGIFDAEFTNLFPDLPDSDKPETTLAMHQSPDGTMYWIAGQEGMLLRVDADSPSSSSTVMDLSGGIFYHSYEEGLLDFAFSPMFNSNGYFYVSWTVNEPFKRNRLSKFEYYDGNPDATRASEEVLLQGTQRPKFYHNGGWLGFKPSDYSIEANYHDLYWAQGDGGPQQDPNDHGQRTDTLFGKVVRVSVPSKGSGYEVPSDNYPGAELPEICAIGFRNNWRCGFDRLTDELYCGDVGHNDIESIYIVECGNNYGWVRFEGSRCTEYSEDTYGPCADVDRSSFTFPAFEYCHVDYDSSLSSEDEYTGGNDICGDRSIVGNTVIGGYVYRGQAYADLLYGAYVFADHSLRNIHYIKEQDDGMWMTGTIIGDRSVAVLSFAEDMNGEIFIIDSNNEIYYLPCGDLCVEAEIPDDDDPVSYTYLGCYGDNRDRIFSGNSLQQYAEMTTETLCPSNNKDESTWVTFPPELRIYDKLQPLYYGHKETNVLTRPPSPEPPGSSTIGCTQFCAGFCLGSPYFGTQYGRECWCGEATDDPTILGSATCNRACFGDSSQICGGRYAMSVYEYELGTL